ncbi:MAG: Asp-tRNA(Asn)/Glu-tRNA(Gln) amidotransferase subunit GatA [Candidatus Portnoybacteria bacterium]|nr:Asp-tRNA(Asn)/Glu-tRNA(Gln) amidotransferase subunit GatA [Candidatus Portnoybacteria bacterium]
MELNELTIKQAGDGLRSGGFSSVELTKAVLNTIRVKDGDINAYLEITEKLALEQAEIADKLIKRGHAHLLCGMPVAVKDNIMVEGVRCTAGSKVLENYIAPYDATVIKKIKAAGAVIVGKTNLDEFAMGSSTENSAFGSTRNPHDLERVPGGSSGGSAAAVAGDETIYALGSDTGGSIRQPASFCGVAGFKPTYGRVSRYGLIAMASSLDQVGPLTKTVGDAAIVLSAIEGRDEFDSTSAGKDIHYPALDEARLAALLARIEDARNLDRPLAGVKIGIPNEYFAEGIEPAVEERVRQAILAMENLGASIDGISLSHTDYALACYYVIAPSEISANLARYDGIKYGASATSNFSAKGGQLLTSNLLDVYLKTRGEYLGREARRRIVLGVYALSAGYHDAYYLKAQKVRSLIKKDFDEAFERFDVLVAPTSPTVAFLLGERTADPVRMYLSDIYTIPVSLAGIPAVSVPCGLADGLPVGLQIIGRRFDDETILRVAGIYEACRG